MRTIQQSRRVSSTMNKAAWRTSLPWRCAGSAHAGQQRVSQGYALKTGRTTYSLALEQDVPCRQLHGHVGSRARCALCAVPQQSQRLVLPSRSPSCPHWQPLARSRARAPYLSVRRLHGPLQSATAAAQCRRLRRPQAQRTPPQLPERPSVRPTDSALPPRPPACTSSSL